MTPLATRPYLTRRVYTGMSVDIAAHAPGEPWNVTTYSGTVSEVSAHRVTVSDLSRVWSHYGHDMTADHRGQSVTLRRVDVDAISSPATPAKVTA